MSGLDESHGLGVLIDSDQSLQDICCVNGIRREEFIQRAPIFTKLELFMSSNSSIECVRHFPGLEVLS